jgi:hypothetical protein
MIKMEVQDILKSKENLIEFLKSKNFKEIEYNDKDYIYGTYFQISDRKILVVYEASEEKKIKEIKDHFHIDKGLSYCIIRINNKLIFSRNFGENKHFIYSETTKDNESKVDKLKKIGDSIDLLFQSKDISKKFYESFKTKRNLLVNNIKNDISDTKKFLLSQKIFDRVFFIYFLCHKNIIRFEDGREISGKNLFSRILLEHGNFLDNLKQLFTLFNTKDEDLLEIGDYKLIIPYLNGGLFKLENLEYELNISIDKSQWKEIFEFLNSYHWIIEDIRFTEENVDKPDEDVDKILTPDILGHVYERSVVEWEIKGFEEVVGEAVEKVSERKKKGVYYTPESITDYITQNTIIPYLLDKLGNKYNSFNELIESKDKKSKKKAINILNEIKILDPACGSGAFLTKAAELLFNLERRLYYSLGSKVDLYDLKLHIITENIYGVDILSGAVEISRLRLWLWLIAHYKPDKEMEPLPNIEYNIMCGNSLLGVESKVKQTLRNKELRETISKFEEIKREYKRSHIDTSDTIKEVIEEKLDSLRNELNKLYIKELNRKGIKIVKVEKSLQFNLDGNDTSAKYIYLKEFEQKYNPFHWILEFSEVFKEPKSGFDVIVGNPPYGNLLKSEEKEIMDFYETIKCNEIAANFVERCMALLNNNSYFGQIITNALAINKSTFRCRDLIRKNFIKTNLALFNTRPVKIFEDAEIRVMIMIAQKCGKSGEIFTTDAIKLTPKTKENFQSLIKFESTKGLELGKRKIGDGKDTALPKVGHVEIRKILEKLKQKSNITFGDIIGNGNYSLDIRKTGRYWLIALVEFPYQNSKIKRIYFLNEVERDFALLLINSSLFYLFWSTYGNLRDLSVSLFEKFPCPPIEELHEKADEINFLKNKLDYCLNKNHDLNRGQPGIGEFNYSKCKKLIDEADELISNFYELGDLTNFVINYDSCIRPNEPDK